MKKILLFSKWLFSRNIFLYAAICLIWFLLGGQRAWMNAHLRSFNRTAPDFSALAEFAVEGHPVTTDSWQEALRYYTNIKRFFPKISGASGLAGACYFYLGQDDKAMKNLMYAVEHEGQIAIFHYNLAILYYNAGEYEKAAKTISPIFSADKTILIQVIMENKFFRQIFSAYPGEVPFEQMWDVFIRQAGVILIKSYYLAGNYEQASGAARYGLLLGTLEDKTVCAFAAKAALETRQIDLALQYVEKGLEDHPNDPVLLEMLSQIFQALGRDDNARRFFMAAQRQRMRGVRSHLLDISKENLLIF